ncbi:MAG TPA: phosphoenolpyruvate carboxylase [Alcanivoracaceae bacterium]|nr:phosphoenolpyruvate carboxylase [Alcanivoracaceae bacterium]
MTQDLHAPLRQDVRTLGEILGYTLKTQKGEDMFALIERIRQVSVESRTKGVVDMTSLSELFAPLNEQELLDVARAFNQFLNLSNLAEQQHRVRLRRQNQFYAADGKSTNNLPEILDKLLAAGYEPDQIHNVLSSLSVELVLTAHPTEISRRTLIQKYDHIAAALADLERTDLSASETHQRRQQLCRGVLSAWCTDEIRRSRPTPVDEAKWGFVTLERSLWYAVPDFLRDLDGIVTEKLGKPLSVRSAPVHFASWMGGDRDGNPNVTAAVTREVTRLARWKAADLYLSDVTQLMAECSMQKASAELLAVTGPSYEPYRVILRELREELRSVRSDIEKQLEGQEVPVNVTFGAQMRESLLLIDRSLRDCGMGELADGSLRDTLRRLYTFGTSLLRLDIRQESTRHSQALDAITQYLGLGSYVQWDEKQRQQFLLKELEGNRPLVNHRFRESEWCTQEVAEVLDTCAVIAEQPAEALGAYVISMATSPSDVLAVMLLQKEAGVLRPMRVVPLFETLEDLKNAKSTMAALLEIPWYKNQIMLGQEIMIGYSDSAKDAGFLAAAWAQYNAQEKLADLFQTHHIPLTLFHGRGGSVSRGGGTSTHMAVLSQPPGSVAGRIRVTEQGEVIRFKYGHPQIAMHNLEQYVAATLEATLMPPVKAKPEWREEMDRLTATSVKSYRSVVQENPDLVRYLRTVTPEQELSRLALGSRPARRTAVDNLASLRAIPWVFAWTQVRLILSAWLGTGAALEEALADPKRRAVLEEMQQEWPFFQALLDMLEMVLAKTDSAVAAYYERRLTDDPALKALGQQLRNALASTIRVLQELTGRTDLLENNPVMSWSVRVRNPYTDPLHLLQAELMGRLRHASELTQEQEKQLESALMVTIAGIAAGMRNTG